MLRMSSLFPYPGLVDWRAELPRASWRVGIRPATTSITIHYNGPAVAPFRQHGNELLIQLQGDARYQMRPGWGGTVNGAPGLMYHFVVGSDGQVYQTRDLDEILWHCAHADGNTNGLSVHFPLGGTQDATPEQWAAGIGLIDALRARYSIPLRRVYGHIEWKHATLCPGRLQPRVEAYRAHLAPFTPHATSAPGLRRFIIKRSLTAPARVRQAPATHWPDGSDVGVAGRLKPGTIMYVDVVKTDGEALDGERRWVHMARVPNEQADLGFVSWTLVDEV